MRDCYVARSRSVASRLLGEELIIMSAVDSTLFNLNPAGTLIWQAADGTMPLSKIVEERICAEFAVESEEAMRDAQEFVANLAAHGILQVAESPIVDQRESTVKLP